MAKLCNVGLIGQGFMGRTHSNAYLKVSKFFLDLPLEPVMHTVFGMKEEKPEVFARRWGWQQYATDWKKVVRDEAIDLVDIVTPNFMHMPPAMAALEAGKPVASEKPIAGTLADARAMVQAAKKAKAKTFVWYNYRRCPAVALAHQLVKAGKIGRIFHVRCIYLQDWGGPDTPLLWRFQKKLAGSGAHGDLNSHIVDLALWLVGPIAEVTGMMKTFVTERTLPGSEESDKVTVDDAAAFLARFANNALGTFEATRFATGRKNGLRFEINGSKGSIVFDLERLNELLFYDSADAQGRHGFRLIQATDASHPYIAAYWPRGHIIGYEHSFINTVVDLLGGIADGTPVHPTFADGFLTQKVLDAVAESAQSNAWVRI